MYEALICEPGRRKCTTVHGTQRKCHLLSIVTATSPQPRDRVPLSAGTFSAVDREEHGRGYVTQELGLSRDRIQSLVVNRWLVGGGRKEGGVVSVVATYVCQCRFCIVNGCNRAVAWYSMLPIRITSRCVTGERDNGSRCAPVPVLSLSRVRAASKWNRKGTDGCSEGG